MIDTMIGLLLEPRKEVDAAAKKMEWSKTLLVLAGVVVLLFVGAFLNAASNEIKIDVMEMVVGIIKGIVILLALALVLKVSFDILSDNKSDGYLKSVTALTYGMVAIGVMFVIMPIFIYAVNIIQDAGEYDLASYVEYVNLLVTVCLALHGVATMARAYSKFFSVDYIPVMLTMSLVVYAFYIVLIQAIMSVLAMYQKFGSMYS